MESLPFGGGGNLQMTARLWSRAGEAMTLLVAGFLLVPGPLPLPSPPLPASPITLPSPTVPAILPTPSAIAAASPTSTSGAGARPSPISVATPNSPASSRTTAPPHGVPIPFTAVYVDSPLDIALIAALMALPLLLAIWLLVFGKTIAGARRARDAHVRLRLAADLGLHPRDLMSMSTRKLFQLRDKAAYDELTGVLSVASGIGAADREIARARRKHSALTVAFIGVDDLKTTNQDSGRAGGDDMLRRLADLLKRGLRGEDVVMRYAGGEFVCVLPETALRDGRARLDEIQRDASAGGIRFSAGFAELESNDDVVSLFSRADRELFEFKAHRGEIVPLPVAGAPRAPQATG